MTQKFSIKGFADDSITGDKIAGFTSATDGFVITKSSCSLNFFLQASTCSTIQFISVLMIYKVHYQVIRV